MKDIINKHKSDLCFGNFSGALDFRKTLEPVKREYVD